MTIQRYALRDDQWERLRNSLPGREGYVGATAKDNRLFVEAVLYRYRAGIRGETCQSGSTISAWYTRASVGGARLECGSGCFST